VVDGATVLDIPASFWNAATSGTKGFLLFEGVSEGKGELTMVFKKNGAELGQGGSVFIELLDVRKMYERGKISGAASIPDPNTTSATSVSGVTATEDPNGFNFKAAWDEDKEDKSYIICVHGWRKTYHGARSDEITIFKRLWHRGFKGRYAGFYWPTLTGGEIEAKYNHSEYRAWKCGNAFKSYVESTLPSGYRKCVIAHSLGNIVVGSALKNGLRFDRYAMLNAAIPAQCFDAGAGLRQAAAVQSLPTGLWWPFNVANYNAWAGGDLGDDPLPGLSSLSYRNRVGPASVGQTRIINFYLPDDEALSAWEANQWSAGDGVPGIDSKPIDGYDYQIGVKLHYDPIGPGDRAVTDPHEAMAMVNQSMTKPAGNESRTAGSVKTGVDLNAVGMAFDKEHEAAFKWLYCKTWKFYARLLEEMNYQPVP
jgi:hypothetical protein